MAEDIAYQHGEFISRSKMGVSLTEPGFVLGITVSERLRTFGGRVFRWEQHLSRLKSSLQIVNVTLPESDQQVSQIIDRIVTTNYRQLAPEEDLGLVILCDPKTLDSAEGQLRIYSYPLPFDDWADLYHQGQRLIVSQVTQVPASCWPSALKCRSRMHYYLADREATRRDPTARAILLDTEGFVTEASTANLVAFFRNEGLVSPPSDKIISGISLAVVRELGERMGIPFTYRDLRTDDLLNADEVMLCSTSPCVYPVTTIDGNLINRGERGKVSAQLLAAWSEEVGTDIVAQASACR